MAIRRFEDLAEKGTWRILNMFVKTPLRERRGLVKAIDDPGHLT